MFTVCFIEKKSKGVLSNIYKTLINPSEMLNHTFVDRMGR